MPIDYKNYHPKWSLISRLIRTHRAQNCCEWCGAANGKPHPGTGSTVVLTVAHLDRDRNNNRFANLAALCQRCHLNHDRQTHIFNRQYGRETKYLNGVLFEPDHEQVHQTIQQICTQQQNATRPTECFVPPAAPLPELPFAEYCLAPSDKPFLPTPPPAMPEKPAPPGHTRRPGSEGERTESCM